MPGDIIISHKCTKNHDHIMLYCFWDLAHDRCSFWAIFCPFKTPGDIINLHMCTKKYDQMLYGSWDMVQGRDKRTADRWTDEWTDGKVTYRGGCPT